MRRSQWIFIAAMTVIVAAIMVGERLSKPTAICPYNQGQSKQENQTESQEGSNDDSFWYHPLQHPDTSFSFWVAVFTAVLAVSTIGLWIATGRSASIARRAHIDLERPFLFMEIVDPGVSLDGGQFAFKDTTFRIVNYGRTPAQLIHLARVVRCVIVSPGSRHLPEPVDPTKTADVYFPVGSVIAPEKPGTDYYVSIFQGLMSVPDVYEVIQDKRAIFFLGYVRYRDIFGIYHVTGFSSIFDRGTNEFIRIGGDKYNYTKTEGKRPGFPLEPKTS
jgi:hypothetical protein